MGRCPPGIRDPSVMASPGKRLETKRQVLPTSVRLQDQRAQHNSGTPVSPPQESSQLPFRGNWSAGDGVALERTHRLASEMRNQGQGEGRVAPSFSSPPREAPFPTLSLSSGQGRETTVPDTKRRRQTALHSRPGFNDFAFFPCGSSQQPCEVGRGCFPQSTAARP